MCTRCVLLFCLQNAKSVAPHVCILHVAPLLVHTMINHARTGRLDSNALATPRPAQAGCLDAVWIGAGSLRGRVVSSKISQLVKDVAREKLWASQVSRQFADWYPHTSSTQARISLEVHAVTLRRCCIVCRCRNLGGLARVL